MKENINLLMIKLLFLKSNLSRERFASRNTNIITLERDPKDVINF